MKDSTASELVFLFKMLPVTQEASSVDEIYRLLLAISTMGRAIGYRRAMLFVVDDDHGAIRGRFGVERGADGARPGPDGATFEQRAREVFSVYEAVESTDISLKVKSFSVPLAWHRSGLVKTAKSAYPVMADREMHEYSTDPFFDFFDTTSYVAVPIKFNDRVSAVLAADQRAGGRQGIDDIAVLYSLSQHASAAAQKLLDISDHRRRSRIVRKLQQTLNAASTPEKLDEALRLAMMMLVGAVGGSGCLLKDFTRQKTIHVKAVQEYSPDADDDDIAVSQSFDGILDEAAGKAEPIRGDSDHPLLSSEAAEAVRSFYATPLVSGDDVTGALAIYTEADGPISTRCCRPEDRNFVDLCAGVVASRLEAGQLESRMKRIEDFFEDVSSNLARERDRSKLAERSIEHQRRINDDLKRLRGVLSKKTPYAKRFPKVSELVEEMLQYSRRYVQGVLLKDSHYEMADIFDLTRRVVQSCLPDIQKEGIEVTVRIPSGGPMLLVDREKISLALRSILKATASCLGRGNKMLVECSTSEGRILICVADNGKGLPGDTVSRLFMPFESVDERDEKKRALSLAAEIIQKHSGEILIRSSMSWKTILILSFPRAANRDRRRSRRDRRQRVERRAATRSS